MAEKVCKCSVKKESGYLYFLDKDGNVSRAKMSRGRGKQEKGKPECVEKCQVKKDSGFLYFVDKEGDVSRAEMSRGR